MAQGEILTYPGGRQQVILPGEEIVSNPLNLYPTAFDAVEPVNPIEADWQAIQNIPITERQAFNDYLDGGPMPTFSQPKVSPITKGATVGALSRMVMNPVGLGLAAMLYSPKAEGSISSEPGFIPEPEPEPTWFPPTTSSGIGGDVDEQDYRSQVYEALSGMKTGVEELDVLGKVGSAIPDIKSRLKDWVSGGEILESSDPTVARSWSTLGLEPPEVAVNTTSDRPSPRGIKPTGNWTWDHPGLSSKILGSKFRGAITGNIIDPIDSEVRDDLGISNSQYDALVHLIGMKDIPGVVKAYETIDRMTGDPENVWEQIKDARNNQVGESYQGTDATPQEMLNDERVIITHDDAKDYVRGRTASLDIPIESEQELEASPTAEEKREERNRQSEVKAAERDASAERAAKERAERAKEAARTERDRARAEQDRLAALSRQRAAEEKARKAAQSAAQKAYADRKKKAQQSASAAALASARMESIRQANIRKEKKKLEDQMARYQTTGRWIGGL